MFVGFAPKAIDAIGGNQQVIVIEFSKVGNLTAKFEIDVEFDTASLQDVQQALARDAGNDMAATADCLPAVTGIDSIPDHELIANLLICFIIGSLVRGKCAIGEDDAPAISYTGRSRIDDRNIMRG